MRDPCVTWSGPIRTTGTYREVSVCCSSCVAVHITHLYTLSIYKGAVGEFRLGVRATRLGKTLRNSSRTLTAFTLLLARTSL